MAYANGSDKKSKPSREERLAEQLRQNLHRRKAQARALDSDSDSPETPATPAKPA